MIVWAAPTVPFMLWNGENLTDIIETMTMHVEQQCQGRIDNQGNLIVAYEYGEWTVPPNHYVGVKTAEVLSQQDFADRFIPILPINGG